MSVQGRAEGWAGKGWIRAVILKLERAREITWGSARMWILIQQLWVGSVLLHF